DLFPSFQLVNNITRFSKGAGHASRHGRAHFGRLVNAADMGENCLYAVDDFRFKKRMPSRAAAVRELLKRTAAVGQNHPRMVSPARRLWNANNPHTLQGPDEKRKWLNRAILNHRPKVRMVRLAIVQCAVSVEPSSSTGASSGPAAAVVVVSSHSIGSGLRVIARASTSSMRETG